MNLTTGYRWKLKLTLTVILCLYLILSCHPGVTMDLCVENNTSYDLQFKTDLGHDDRSGIIQSGDKETIHSSTGPQEDANLAHSANYIEFFLNDTCVYLQNPIVSETWLFERMNEAHYVYTLTLNDDSLSVVL